MVEAVGLFDIGYDLSTLMVLRNGRVLYTRDHPFGAHQLLEEIIRRYDMTAEQAGFFKRGEPGPEDFEDAVLAYAANLVGATAVVTRNTKDFRYSPVKALDPSEFLSVFDS